MCVRECEERNDFQFPVYLQNHISFWTAQETKDGELIIFLTPTEASNEIGWWNTFLVIFLYASMWRLLILYAQTCGEREGGSKQE